MKNFGRICVITDTIVQHRYSHYDIAELALKGGADIIQFRDKKMSTSEMIETCIAIQKFCSIMNKLFIINDRVDIAMIVDADGVHLGKEDIRINDARNLLGKNKIIGATANTLFEALRAQKNGADYVGFGHIFKTESKIKTARPKGLQYLNIVVSSIKIPVLAIGGINLENVMDVLDTGVHGIAVISAVVKAKDPFENIKNFKEIIYGKKN